MGATLEPAGSTCTILEERPEYARLPPNSEGYLAEKVRYALKAPRIVTIRLPDGSTTTNLLKQVVVSMVIRRDEYAADFFWMYKAEVSFDMTPSIATRGLDAPIPILASDKSQGPGRRHSLNPFPRGVKAGFLRRPDVIIAKNPGDRWPGRGPVDLDGASHTDNLLRLVEIKFPGDSWGMGQENAYQQIAGSRQRMSVLDVSDCDGDLEKARQRALASSPAPQPAQSASAQRLRAPVRTQQPIPQAAWYEDWIPGASTVREMESAVAAMWDSARQGASALCEETKAWLHKEAPWMFTAGRWIADQAGAVWTWVDEQGNAIARYTAEQLKAGWQELVRRTDMTWEMLRQIDWGQVGITLAKGVAVVVVIVAAVAIAFVLAEALVAILAALVAIVSTASAAGAAALALAVGAAAVATQG